jgi:hypothetical protein
MRVVRRALYFIGYHCEFSIYYLGVEISPPILVVLLFSKACLTIQSGVEIESFYANAIILFLYFTFIVLASSLIFTFAFHSEPFREKFFAFFLSFSI